MEYGRQSRTVCEREKNAEIMSNSNENLTESVHTAKCNRYLDHRHSYHHNNHRHSADAMQCINPRVYIHLFLASCFIFEFRRFLQQHQHSNKSSRFSVFFLY